MNVVSLIYFMNYRYAMKLFIIALVAGIVMIAIGVAAIIVGSDDFAFVRGMMLVITGMIVAALGYRFKRLNIK
ncbi:MAG: hypothetical protein KatS3mg003_0310 [Candidatus Nitrosocaldaceae archaeon]|nr:MAG: hypothetical protein KatS3mg003_0310 [Candidatus Nitrosocaldaceae archaeon]